MAFRTVHVIEIAGDPDGLQYRDPRQSVCWHRRQYRLLLNFGKHILGGVSPGYQVNGIGRLHSVASLGKLIFNRENVASEIQLAVAL